MKRTLWGFIRKELAQAMRDPRMRALLFVSPMIQLVVFGLALSTEVRNIQLAVAARPEDAFTRRLSERFQASGWFQLVPPGPGDPFEWVRSGRVEAVLVAPPEGALTAMARGHADYQLLIDSLNATRARGIEDYAKSVFDAHLRAERLRGPPSFSFSTRLLYNPAGDTAIYMIPGTLCLMLCLVTVVLTSMSMARERELGTLEMLFAAPISPWEILLGKTVPYILLGMLDLPLVLFVAKGFAVPILAPLWMMMIAGLVFVSTTVCCGFLVSSYSASQQQAMLGGFLFLFPAIQLSGVIFPVENMPRVITWISYLDPLRYFVVLIRHFMLKGGDWGIFLPMIAAMSALGAAALGWSAHRFKQTLN